MPEGLRVDLDRSVRTFRQGTVLVGGHPGRLITLSPEGVTTLASLLSHGTTSAATGSLARRLVDAGMAHPRPTDRGTTGTGADTSLTVVVPVHNRSAALDRCLGALGSQVPVVVVDDASDDPVAVAEVCRRHQARLIRRTANGGPAAARNDALSIVDSELVAFVDSDCTVTEDWLGCLVWLFDDPAIGAVAPRVRPLSSGRVLDNSALARFSVCRSPLDMGPDPSEVGPDRSVRYVPSAALVARRSVVADGFDPGLRVGEDVDLVWRILARGWRVRYEPSVNVFHGEPTSWKAWLTRRFHYGTSAGALSRRHPGRLAPVELRLWPTVAAAAALTGRYRTSLAVVSASTAVLAWSVRQRGIPASLILRWSAGGVGWTVVGVGRAATMLAGPALLLATILGGRTPLGGQTALGRRAASAATVLLVVPPVIEWRQRRPQLGLMRWSLASIVDDMSYGAGVWTGCFRWRSLGPLVPALRLRQGDPPVRRVTPGATDLM